jgi:hypothetical protein
MSPSLDTEIITVLSADPDKFFSQAELYDIIKGKELDSQKLIFKNKQEYVSAFLTIDKRYNNVYRITINKGMFLVWSTKTRSEVFQNIYKEKVEECAEFMTEEDYLSLIDEMLIDANPDFDPNNYINDNMSAVHLLVKCGCLSTLKKVTNLYTIDLYKKTADNKTVFDIVYETKDMETLEYLLRMKHDVEMQDLRACIVTQKKIIDSLKAEHKAKSDKLYWEIKVLTYMCYLMSLGVISMVFFW